MSDALFPQPVDANTVEDSDLRAAKPDMELASTLKRWTETPNIAEELSDEENMEIAQLVLREYEIDEETRAAWKDKYEKWMKFAMQDAEEKTYPWPGASKVIYPIITNAAIQFQARAYPAIIRDKDVVKGTIDGPDNGTPLMRDGQAVMQPGPDGQPQPVWVLPPGAKAKRAEKIGEHMSWQLLDEQEEWEPQTDQMLVILPIVGSMFRKTYFDPGMQRNVSETVNALNVCVNYHAKSFETAPRISEILRLYPWEIEEKIRAGVYLDENYGHDQDSANAQDDDAPLTFIEQHRRYDLDGDGYPEPYIVTVAKDSGKMARIRAAYDMDGVFFSAKDHRVRRIEAIKYYTPYGFIPSPDGGVYDIGFGQLLYPINEAINTSLNQLFDAGHLANTGGGFIGSGMSINGGATRFQIGEFKPVNTSNGNIRDNIFSIPFPGPNPVLFSLLQFLVNAGEKVAAVKDVLVGDLPGDNTSGVATLAMIEQGLAVFSAIYKRIHRSLKSEFKKLFRLNRLYLPRQASYMRGDEWRSITQADYQAGAGVMPVSDPRMVTDMQKLGRAQFLMQFKDDPWFKPREIRAAILEAGLFPDIDRFLVDALPPNPQLGMAVSELQLKKEELEQRERELSIRAAREEADLDIRRGKDKATEIETLSRAILNLANAHKADASADQGWYETHLAILKHQMEALNAAGDKEPVADSPAVAGGTGTPGGNIPAGVPGMAPPPSQQGSAGLPGAPSGVLGAGNPGTMAGGGQSG